jgi:predicted Zn finger-like uncharacterized protein
VKTCCPSCQTIFRVTSEQLRKRAGKVRCGSCRTVFDALNGLLDDAGALPPAPSVWQAPTVAAAALAPATRAAAAHSSPEEAVAAVRASLADAEASPLGPPAAATEPEFASLEPELALSDLPAAAEDLLPTRAARELPEHGRWLEEVTSPTASPVEQSLTRPFAIVAALLVVTLAGQLVFHFRSTIASRVPALRPAFEGLSEALGSKLPLPRHAELLSIETSDLQTDPERNKLLSLQATLRNRASYAQAYPALELTLTDTNDKAVARRVFLPEQYLPPAALDDESLPANADVEIRLWLEAREIHAAGYRLYVFYP